MSEKVIVNYIYGSCYSLGYGDFFLVFDYARGALDIPESKNIIFFASRKDEDFYTDEIFNLQGLKSISYILNRDINKLKYEDNIIYLNKDSLSMKDLKKLYKTDDVHLLREDQKLQVRKSQDNLSIETLKLDSESLGFLIGIDSLSIFYAGALDFTDISENVYDSLLDRLAYENPDIIFLPIGNLGKNTSIKLDKLIKEADSQIFFPTDIGGDEKKSLDFKKSYKIKTTDIRSISGPNEVIEIEIDSEI
ncbi:hypothetical protein [uncultured Anaerococcus sp.]|uniref:hypothetical protein n=1 Tax=uncultured Anaerococcus sp. TaxID=293428 RepID=UPI0025DEE57B|nr:hypothetical protein [uncultured Anaerococcus sp.]